MIRDCPFLIDGSAVVLRVEILGSAEDLTESITNNEYA